MAVSRNASVSCRSEAGLLLTVARTVCSIESRERPVGDFHFAFLKAVGCQNDNMVSGRVVIIVTRLGPDR